MSAIIILSEAQQGRLLTNLDRYLDIVLPPDGGEDDDCASCGGEGYIYDCFDGCCVDAESGCEDCARRCLECYLREAADKKRARIAVLRALDPDLAIGYLIKRKAWENGLTREFILANLHAARAGCPDFTSDERADSAAWVEGLL